MKRSPVLEGFRVLGFLCTLSVWIVILEAPFSRSMSLLIIFGGVLLIVPASWIARRSLDRNPTMERLHWITSVLHVVIMILLGSSLIEALRLFHTMRGVVIPLPAEVTLPLLYLTAAGTLLTVVNLALSGLGAPFAIALSRRIADRWMYHWTRNPMVLATLATLVSAGLYLQSLYFILWVLLLFAPALLYYVKTYEERELEIRFGEPYLAYKRKTSFLWPGRSTRPLQ